MKILNSVMAAVVPWAGNRAERSPARSLNSELFMDWHTIARVMCVCGVLAAAVSPARAQGYALEGGEYKIGGTLPGEQMYPAASIRTTGGYIVWQDNITDGSGTGISARKLDSSLSSAFSPFRVNQEVSMGDNRDYDVLVVGSGFGGSVTALRLVEKGYKVGVLEAGKRFEDADFAATSWDLKKFLWAPKLGCFGIQRVHLLRDCLILAGAGVGGGSLNYANTLYQPPRSFFLVEEVRSGKVGPAGYPAHVGLLVDDGRLIRPTAGHRRRWAGRPDSQADNSLQAPPPDTGRRCGHIPAGRRRRRR